MSCCCGHHHHCSCQSEPKRSRRHGKQHGFLSREVYIERLDEEREILERRLRYLKAELEELRKEGKAAE